MVAYANPEHDAHRCESTPVDTGLAGTEAGRRRRQHYPEPNEHGVFCDERAMLSIGYQAQRIRARVLYLQVGECRWAWGYEYRIGAWSCGCGGPSIHRALRSEDNAICAGLQIVIKCLAPAAAGARGEGYSPEVRRHATRAIEHMLAAISDSMRRRVVKAVIAGAPHG